MLFRVYVHVVFKDFSALSSGGSNSVFLPVPVVPYVTSALCTLLVIWSHGIPFTNLRGRVQIFLVTCYTATLIFIGILVSS